VLESEEKPVEEATTVVESVSQEQGKSEPQVNADESKPAESAEVKIDDAAIEKPVESVGENVEQSPPTAPVAEGETKTEAAPAEGDEKLKLSEEKLADLEGSDTTDDIDSDFDVMEEIDPSYGIDSSLWKKVKDFDDCDFKPEKKDAPEGEKGEEKKPRKEKEEVVEEEDSGFSELVVIRSEKEKDQDFREYIRELCRPSIVSYLPDRVAPKGSDVRLTCTVKGNNIQTRWMKNDEVLERGKNVQTRTDGEIHILEITQITEKNAGVYTVAFKNRAGEVETSSRIKVFDGKLHKPDYVDIALVQGKFK
jgi:Immunoglobulin I-set domain